MIHRHRRQQLSSPEQQAWRRWLQGGRIPSFRLLQTSRVTVAPASGSTAPPTSGADLQKDGGGGSDPGEARAFSSLSRRTDTRRDDGILDFSSRLKLLVHFLDDALRLQNAVCTRPRLGERVAGLPLGNLLKPRHSWHVLDEGQQLGEIALEVS
jgi:hypothetical protein